MSLRILFLKLSGNDYNLIRICNKKLQNRFVIIGGFLFIINILCFISCYFFFTALFQNYIIGIPIAIFFSWLIKNLYLLLLSTLTKNVLPHVKVKKTKLLSFASRIIFIAFIAIIISKPIETSIYSIHLTSEINLIKHEKIQRGVLITSAYLDKEVEQLKLLVEREKKLDYGDKNERVIKYKTSIIEKEKHKQNLTKTFTDLVNKSNYYVESIMIMNTKYYFCWILTTITILIFFIPAGLKYFTKGYLEFYELKEEIETKLVKGDYIHFKRKYSFLFFEQFQKKIELKELYHDAPFNTIPIEENKNPLNENDLINELYYD